MGGQLQIYRFLDGKHDYTFRFYPNGAVTIIDNETNATVKPKELTGSSLEFYARKNIHFIKNLLREATSTGKTAG